MARAASSSGAKRTPVAKRPAAVSAAKRVPKNEVVIPKATGGPSALETGWLMVAGWIGSAFRLLGQEDLPKEDRRDGVPFALVLFAVAGIIVAWFNVNQAWAATGQAGHGVPSFPPEWAG